LARGISPPYSTLATARGKAKLAETSGTKNIYVRLITEAFLEPVAGGGEI